MKNTMLEKGVVVNGRYEVADLIGEGGTSSVYLVADRHIGRTLAMKVMDRRQLGALRFARSEIEMLRCVNYPLFPGIHDAFCDNDNIYIVSEYVRGTALSSICRQGGLSKEVALSIALRICDALTYLHEMPQTMLYLDLKPDNIIMDDEGLPHLIDFGIAGWLCARHIPVGTIGYSPPEQYKRDGVVDERADIFALGMTYYAIRHGVPPDRDPNDTIKKIRHSNILGPSERTFLTKCCAVSPDKRYKSAREVSKKLRRIRSTPNRLKKRLKGAAVSAGLVILGTYVTGEAVKVIRQNEAAAQLVQQATGYMEEGQYTPEGIGIIKACIESGTLSKDCEQEFIFEVAEYSMLISKDYRTAAAYFAKLDPAKYPEADDYLELCKLQTGFDNDPGKAQEVAGRLFSDIVNLAPSRVKYENMIFVAECFETYDPDEVNGCRKALSVINMAISEIDDEADSNGEDLSDIRTRLASLADVKRRKMNIRKTKEKMIGETDEKQDL